MEQAGWAIGKPRVKFDLDVAVVPFDTVSTDDYFFFPPPPPDWAVTGARVRVSETGNGLTAGTDYFLGNIRTFSTARSASLYTTEEAALAGGSDGLVDLTGRITAKIGPASTVRSVEGVSLTPYESGPLTESTAKSRIDSVDTDGDGLSDFDEFFLGTDPSSPDTDSDGINDIVELNGYKLPHNVGTSDLGIIKTDPLDADTDNDKRSDGEEAELVDSVGNERNRWIVRVKGQSPYRAFSNPLVADADFDGLVDFDEYFNGTDPNNGNTDGDSRDDGVEVKGNSNPLATNIQVTAVVKSATFGSNGAFAYQLSVRMPDDDGIAGLSTSTSRIYGSDPGAINEIGRCCACTWTGPITRSSPTGT